MVFFLEDVILDFICREIVLMFEIVLVKIFLRIGCYEYEVMIRDLCLEGKVDVVFWFRRKLMLKRYIFNVVTYNYLVNAFCKGGYLEKVDCFIREMLD